MADLLPSSSSDPPPFLEAHRPYGAVRHHQQHSELWGPQGLLAGRHGAPQVSSSSKRVGPETQCQTKPPVF